MPAGIHMESKPAITDIGVQGAEDGQRFRRMADAVPVLIWVSDVSKACTWFNKWWLDFTGRPMQELLGDGWAQDVYPDDLNRCLNHYITHFDSRKPFVMEYRLRRHDGEYRWVVDNGIPWFDPAGEFVGYIGSCVDFTDRKQAEDRLSEADRRKNEFLAMLAHELRNPLAAVRNAAKILLRTDSDARTVRAASEILDRQVEHMVRQVDDLLDVSRISRGGIQLRKERTELAPVVNDAVESTRALCASLRHEMIVTLPPHPIYLHGDPVRLAQIVGNLLNNACKFTNNGGRIWLTVEKEGEQAVIRVRDTGLGLAADQLPRIFELFLQVDTSLERARDGLGLGLALVKNLVEMHDGTVEARSAGLGQGSEFVVRLPLLSGALPAPPRERSGIKPVATVPRRILVVDDNLDSAKSLSMLLKLMGHEVDTAHDGLEAVGKAAAFRADVVLLDIGMPVLNGYDAARRIREQQRHKGPRLVALTGWGQEADRRRSEEAGFDAHLVKPVDLADLTKLLAAWEAG